MMRPSLSVDKLIIQQWKLKHYDIGVRRDLNQGKILSCLKTDPYTYMNVLCVKQCISSSVV